MLDQSSFQSRIQFADFLEMLVLATGNRAISQHQIVSSMPSDWIVDDFRLSVALKEMKRRQLILGARYPFSVEDGFVVHHSRGDRYKLLLVLSYATLLKGDAAGGTLQAAEMFEASVERSLSTFLGSNTQVVNFGWPSRSGRPPEFPAAVAWLAGKMGIDVGSAYRSPKRKDGGVDLILWKDFQDKRIGLPVVLCQVTIQRDFVPKSRDIDRRIWSGWLAMDTDPMVALCVPFVLDNNEDWFEVARNALPLDRLRLCGEGLEDQAATQDEQDLIDAVIGRVADEIQ